FSPRTPVLRGQVLSKFQEKRLYETLAGGFGRCLVVRNDRHPDTNQSGITAVIADGIRHETELRRVFIGYHAGARLIPIEHHALFACTGNDVAVDRNRLRLTSDLHVYHT